MKKKLVWIVPIIVMVTAFLLFRFVLFIGYVPTESMEPTIHKGSIVIGSHILGELEVGDIIVFRHAGKLLVKRIAGIEGDTVIHRGEHKIVPNGNIYVLGDNPKNSFDSRYWETPYISIHDAVAIIL